jgi:hypothetical protein
MHLPSGKALKGDDLVAFQGLVDKVETQYAALMGDTVMFASTDTAPVPGTCETAETPC